MHKLSENYKAIELFPITDIASATTTNGTGVDCLGLRDDLVAVVQLGAMTGTHTCDVTIQESDASGSGYAAISGAVFTQTDANSDNTIACIGFKRTKRYVRASIVTAGTVTSNIIGISGLIKAEEGKVDLNSATAA